MTDTLTKQNPLLKSIAAFFVVFGVLPVLVIAAGLIFFNSNFSMCHFNLYYLILSIVCSTPIYLLYRKRKSDKIFNDGVLFLFASITAVSYVTEDEFILNVKRYTYHNEYVFLSDCQYNKMISIDRTNPPGSNTI